jgi:large subunit ribosomal protein L35
MPKLKTHKAAASRLKVTAGGKLLRMKGLRGHLRRRRAKRNKQQYDKMLHVSAAETKRLSRLVPYGTP